MTSEKPWRVCGDYIEQLPFRHEPRPRARLIIPPPIFDEPFDEGTLGAVLMTAILALVATVLLGYAFVFPSATTAISP